MTTDGAGTVGFQVTLPAGSASGEVVTATATDPAGNTSEFSAPVAVVGSPNLAVTMQRSPASPLVGSPITYTFNIVNSGGAAATNVTLVDTLPAALAFMSYTSSAGTCVNASGVVTCNLGTLGIGLSASVDITAQPLAAQSIVNPVSVSAAEIDSNPTDNISQDTVLVAAYGQCSAMSLSGPFVYHTGGATPATIATGDFNKDGFIDVIAGENTDNTVAFMPGNGTGAFPTVTHIPAGTAPAVVVKGDFNQDGKLDFVAQSNGTANLNLVLGNGDGTFASATPIALPFLPFSVAGVDLEPDGDLDLVASPQSSGSTVAVLLNNGTGAFGSPTTFAAGTAPTVSVFGNFDANPGIDLAVANEGGTTVSILSGNGAGGFGAPSTLTLPQTVQRVRRIDDVNGDGRLELAVTTSVSFDDDSLYLLTSNGSGGFNTAVEINGPEHATWVESADFNKDGLVDLFVTERDFERVMVLAGTGGGSFAAPVVYFSHEIRSFFELVDLNNDGRIDIAGTKGEDAGIFVFLNTCASTTTTDLSVSVLGPASASAGDQVQYTLRVTNNGPSTATNVVVKPNATEGFDFLGTSCGISSGGDELDCNVASLPPGGFQDFTFDLLILSGVQQVFATATATEGDPDPSNNFATLTTNVAAGPLTLEVTTTDNGYDFGSLLHALEVSNNNPGGDQHHRLQHSRSGPAHYCRARRTEHPGAGDHRWLEPGRPRLHRAAAHRDQWRQRPVVRLRRVHRRGEHYGARPRDQRLREQSRRHQRWPERQRRRHSGQLHRHQRRRYRRGRESVRRHHRRAVRRRRRSVKRRTQRDQRQHRHGPVDWNVADQWQRIAGAQYGSRHRGAEQLHRPERRGHRRHCQRQRDRVVGGERDHRGQRCFRQH